MDWLKDKKNQPIVAAGLAVIIIGAAAAVYFTMFAGGGSSETAALPPSDTAATGTPTGTPTDMNAGYPPGTAPTTGTPPGAAAAAPAPIPPGGATPMEVWRPDPFLPAGYKPPPPGRQPKPKPPIRDLPFQNWSRWVEEKRKPPPPDLPQPVRRMAGIIVSDRIYAIIESNGISQVVQPGDMLEDRLAMVERIERDKVILKTMDKHPKYLTVRMASAPRTETSIAPSTPGAGTPTSPMGPGYRPRGPRGPAAGIEPMAPM